MAIGWLSLLKSVPWSDVVSNAPLVAEGARKLWNAVVKKSPKPPAGKAAAEAAAPTEQEASAALASRLAVLETAAADLQAQMLASSEVIKALADQNTQLVHRVDTMRIRILWLSGALLVLAIAAAAGVLYTLAR